MATTPHTDLDSAIHSVLKEGRLFPPPPAAKTGAPRWLIDSMDRYKAMYDRSLADPEGFWADAAAELHWFKPWSRVLEWTPPDAKWFVGAQTNLCYNCVDRQVDAGHGEAVAIVWEGEPMPGGEPEVRRLTYADLQRETATFANVLRSLGVKKGDVVTIYMGMAPELAIAMLACARIGAVHSIIFGGFSSQAIVDRVVDAESRIIITCDGAWRRGKVVPLKENVDAACAELAGTKHAVQSVVVLRRCGGDAPRIAGRDHDWAALMEAASADCPCEPMDAEDMLFLLYTSGSTGKPKGIKHTTGGYMVWTYLTSKYVFNLIPDQGQLYWCTADIGWVTGHSYIVYGILPTRVPTLMYEGAPNFPDERRFWEIIQRHRVTQFYTAPTAIRAFMKWGREHPDGCDLSCLQVLGTVGEPINPEAWMWYHHVIGGERCPIVDTWWQTETGGHMITPLPGVTPTKPGSCTLPFFGVDAAILDERGNERGANQGGLLAIRRPWPGMLRGIHGDRERFVSTYFSKFILPRGAGVPPVRAAGKGGGPVSTELAGVTGGTPVPQPQCPSPYYFPGDGARRDEDGYFWIMGRVDDVINVSGHRLGTMEVESALVSHGAVVEAAVVGMPHEIKGTGIAAFCTLEPRRVPSDAAAAEALKKDLAAHVTAQIGAIARPDMIRFTEALPKTRSGKIMRRLLRDIAEGKEQITQDTTTLEDYSVLVKLHESQEA